MLFIEGEDPKINFEAMEKAFLKMKKMVEELYHKAQGGAETSIQVEGEGGCEGPPYPPSPSPSSSSSSSSSFSSFDESEHSSHKKNPSKKPSHSHDLPLLKLYIKFDFLIL
jgi:hypothetical protein